MKMFDMTLTTKNNKSHNFSGLDKKELDIIMDYFDSRKIPVKTVNDAANYNVQEEDDDSDDVKE
jgi:hypothetical protein